MGYYKILLLVALMVLGEFAFDCQGFDLQVEVLDMNVEAEHQPSPCCFPTPRHKMILKSKQVRNFAHQACLLFNTQVI